MADWVTMKTSYGQTLLREYLRILTKKPFFENYRPEWLNGLELDFYFPDAKVGIEFNGDQHYHKTTFGDPSKQINNDIRKKILCKENGVTLRIFEATDLEYTRVAGKLPNGIGNVNTRLVRIEGKELNQRSKDYRKQLQEKYGSPTTHRRNSKIRAAKAEIMDSK